MGENAYVRVRIDPALKEEAALVLDSLGLTISDVMRMTLTRIAREKGLPLELARPNAKTIAAMEEARAIKAGRNARFGNAEALFNAIDDSKPATKAKKSAA
jgi:DNA-damage-inducible protein J